jgi:hypothetical protein
VDLAAQDPAQGQITACAAFVFRLIAEQNMPFMIQLRCGARFSALFQLKNIRAAQT